MRRKFFNLVTSNKKKFTKQNTIFWVFLAILSIVPIGTVLVKVITGAFPFWYDPARDMLSALDNLSKPTLIGPPSGIPGIFYGPYWIWLLSFGELFSKDPRVVDFIVLTIPYFVIFPFVLYLFKKTFSLKVAFLLWLLFLLGFSNYAFYLWNPNPAPLIFLILTLLLLESNFDTKAFRGKLLIVVGGFCLGFLVNFHLSFGIGSSFGVLLFFIFETCFVLIRSKEKNLELFVNRIFNGIIFIFGFLLSLSPFMLFEIRHNFSQTKTFINAFSHFGAVVSTSGLTQGQIVNAFFERLALLLGLHLLISVLIFVVAVVFLVIQKFQRKIIFTKYENKLIAILVSITIGILGIYLTAKNPVWEYHFTGVEILFLLAIGLIINKVRGLRILAFFFLFILTFLFIANPEHSLKNNPKNVAGNLVSEKVIVEKINSDASNHKYTVFVYSPSIYSYEYSYLFMIMYGKKIPYRPELNPQGSGLVYIVFPPQVEKPIYEDFIHYRTPDLEYKTQSRWIMPDKSVILKRVRK